MNYDINKGDVLPVIDDTPSKLIELKSSIVSRANYDIPFFLMPVKMETRFMKPLRSLLVEVYSFEVVTVTGILVSIGTLIDKVIVYEGFKTVSAHKAALELSELFLAAETKAQEIILLQPVEKADLLRCFDTIDSSFADAMNKLVASCDDQNIANDIQSNIIPSVSSSKASVLSFINATTIDNSWQQNSTVSGNDLFALVNNKVNVCNNILPNLVNGQSFHVPTFNSLKSEMKVLVKELNNITIEYNNEDKQLVWTGMQGVQPILDEMNNAVNSTAPVPQRIADMHWLNKKLSVAWQNFTQKDAALVEWVPAPEKSNIPLTEEEITSVIEDVATLRTNVETFVSTNDASITTLENAQGAPNTTLLNSVVDNFNQIRILLGSFPDQFDQVSSRYLWDEISRIDEQIIRTEGVLETLSIFNSGAATTISDSLSLASYILADVWGGKTDITMPTGIENAFSLFHPVNELWIRVYPDDIFIHDHEEDLTLKEKDSGIEFWKEWWAARGDKAKELAAWRALIAIYGVTRAAWIAKATTPTTLASTGTATKATGAVAKIGVLSSYTSKISTVLSSSASGISASIPTFLTHFTPHLDYLTSVITELPHMSASLISVATEEIVKAKADFTSLSAEILLVNAQLANELSAIDAKFTTLATTIENTISIDSWDLNYDANPTFPQVEVKAGSWTAAAFASELPDSFVFATIKDNTADSSYFFNHIKVGNPVPLTLQVGIHPESSVFDVDAFENLKLDPELKWMFDFDEAVRIGMGITIRLTSDEAKAGFDKVLALGVKLGSSAGISTTDAHNYGKDLIEKLFKNHHYSADGMSILTIGTPTNNTDNDNAGFKKPDPDGSLSFETELRAPLFYRSLDKLKRKDGQWIADALGIEYELFTHIENANKRQISGAIAMNHALWPGTIGNFMSEMMNPLITEDNIKRTKEYFSDYVLGRNTVPSIRVGSQPYGILPTTAYTRWEVPYSDYSSIIPNDIIDTYYGPEHHPELFSLFEHYKDWSSADSFFNDRFNLRFQNVLKILNNTWLEIVKHNVKVVDKKSTNVQSDFMELLGTDALMAEVYSRFMINSSNFKTVIDNYNASLTDSKWNTADVKVPTEMFDLLLELKLNNGITELGIDTPIFDDTLIQNLIFHPASTGLPTDVISQILNNAISTFNIDLIKENPLTSIISRGEYLLQGPSVDEKVLSERDPLTTVLGKNYVEWLLSAPLVDVWKNNAFGTMKSRSLLFLLLRQSLLSVYRDTAKDTLVSLNEFSQGAINAIGHSRGVAGQILNHPKQLILTKWHLLFKNKDYLLDATKGLNLAYNYFSEPIKTSPSWWPEVNAYPPYDDIRPSVLFPPSFNDVALADFLYNKTAFVSKGADYTTMVSHTNWDSIDDLKKGFEHIKDLPTADLDMLLREHIDLASYRLDAWNAGMVNKRLWDNRNVDNTFRKKGLYVGAYGWLLDVRPKEKAMAKIDSSVMPSHLKDSKDTVYYDQTNLGFLHTPSISHALTAAILRSGYMSERNSADNKFAVNLSSERVQMAMSLLEGMRNGQSLNALLGYMFERGLHENYPDILPLDEHIYKFRKVFPLEGFITPTSVDDKQTPNQVVDAVELLAEFRNASEISSALLLEPDKSIYEICLSSSTIRATNVFGNITLPSHPSLVRDAIITEIDRIANAIDAVADLAIAEGVFQIAKGNPARSAATMEAFTEGKNPPLPEIVNTSTTGTQIAHKLVNLITPLSGTILGPWTGVDMSPRAKAEPSINQWVADMLCASFDISPASPSSSLLPEKIGCLVTFKDEDDLEVAMDLTLKNLSIQPIDLLYMVKESSYTDELTQRIKAYARKHALNYSSSFTGIPNTVSLNVQLNEKGSSLYLASFFEIHCLLNSVSHLVLQSRYLKAEDFLHNASSIKHTGTVPPYFNTSEIINRAENLYSSFNTDIRTYFEALPVFSLPTTLTITEINTLKSKLQLAADYGIGFAIPDSQIEDFSVTLAKELFDLGERVKSEVLTRYKTATNKRSIILSSTSTEKEKINACLELISDLLGSSFKAIPHYSFDYYTGLETAVMAQLTASKMASTGIMRHHNTTPEKLTESVDTWIYGLARVNDKVEHIETVRMLTEIATTKPLQQMLPVQFPYIAATTTTIEDYWLGLDYPETFEPQGDKYSIAIFDYDLFDGGSSYPFFAGLVFAEWDEALPAKEVTTGISFNYDQPNAKAPQNILLGVHPRNEGSWKLDDLWYTLLDTIEMAKIRMVEPDHFKKKGTDTTTNKFEIFKWVLPAIVGEVTPHNLDVNGDHLSYQGAESVQQVSFEYNPNNDRVPSDFLDPSTPPDSTSPSGFMAKEGADWDKLDADTILSDEELSGFMLLQDQLAEITKAQLEMKQMQEQEEIINNPQQ